MDGYLEGGPKGWIADINLIDSNLALPCTQLMNKGRDITAMGLNLQADDAGT